MKVVNVLSVRSVRSEILSDVSNASRRSIGLRASVPVAVALVVLVIASEVQMSKKLEERYTVNDTAYVFAPRAVIVGGACEL